MTAIVIPWDPTALRLGPLVLAWHGIFTAVGILVGLYLAAWLAKYARVSEEAVWDSAWWVVIGGVVGARLLFVGEHAPYFVASPIRILLINEGGISVFGAVLGGMAGGALFANRRRISAIRLLDAVAPGFMLGQAVGRIGDIVNGEHLGAHAVGLPWAVIYTNPNTLGEIGVPVHPAVAYELVWDFAVAMFAVWVLRRRLLPPGGALWLCLFLYGLGRLWIGFFRLDQRVAIGLGLAQLIGLVAMPLALFGLALSIQRQSTHTSPEAS